MMVQIVDETELLNRDNLLDMELEATVTKDGGTSETKTYQLGDFAKMEYGQGLASISRENQSHYITVTADTMEGYNTTLLTRELNKKLKTYEMEDGYSMEIGGESDQVNDMVTQIQSLLSPFIVLFTIPLAFTGGLLGLLAFGEQLSLMSLLGFTILMGTVVNNGIVFVDYANQLRIGGMERRDALIATGKKQPHQVDIGEDDLDDILDEAQEYMNENEWLEEKR